tara:strand:+ start:169 stop:441 length:273 start_codon:yes stop_codon:yes gene_type:complete
MDSPDLILPDYYIVKKTDGSGKEQIVKFDEKFTNDKNETMYYGYYGINSYHEVFSLKENIRELTEKERTLFSEKKYWSLPQQFYHSFPVC